MSDNTNRTNQLADSRFSSNVSNFPTISEQYANDLIRHNDEMSKLEFYRCSSPSEKVKAFIRVLRKWRQVKILFNFI